jgi:hypothetical protein
VQDNWSPSTARPSHLALVAEEGEAVKRKLMLVERVACLMCGGRPSVATTIWYKTNMPKTWERIKRNARRIIRMVRESEEG